MPIYTASFCAEGHGIGVSGESWDEVVEAARDLGLDASQCLEKVGPRPALRSPPELDPSTQEVVQSPSKDGCQECGGSFGHLSREDAIELFGLPVCSACGKMI